MVPSLYDVAVVGGGPAGSICSILLARRGFHVLLISGGGSSVSSFPETLAPSSLRFLEGLGLSVEYLTAGARPCRRIEAEWDSTASELIEVEWLRCRPGMSIDRKAFDRALLSLAQGSGASLVVGRAQHINVPLQGKLPLEVDILGRSTTIECRVLIEATGRKGLPSTPRLARRHYFDDLVAVSRRVSGAGPVDHEQLRIVATENGWWYFAEHPEDGLTAVFLTDGDLYDRAKGDLESRLRDELSATALPFSIVPAEKGTGRTWCRDARTSCRRMLGRGGWLPIGDAAYTIDPLSGSGLDIAIRSAEGAAKAATEYLHTNDPAALVESAILTSREFSKALTERAHIYQMAASRFSNHPFWTRRLERRVSARR